jgi:hypothetical protein
VPAHWEVTTMLAVGGAAPTTAPSPTPPLALSECAPAVAAGSRRDLVAGRLTGAAHQAFKSAVSWEDPLSGVGIGYSHRWKVKMRSGSIRAPRASALSSHSSNDGP